MRRNRLRELLRDGKPTVGTRIVSSWPTIVELVGHSGMYDYVEFLAEYGPYDLYALENLGRAVELFDHLSGMIKIEQEPRTHLAVRAIGSGIQNVLFADPRTVADVEECVRAVRAEAPHVDGRHGVGMRRDVGVVMEGASQAFVDALDDAVVAVMIEKKPAVENIEAILAVPGLDMVQFGPADFAQSVGLAGQLQHPQVAEAEKHVIETALRMGVAARVELNKPVGVDRYLEMGVKHFSLGIDVRSLFHWWRDAGRSLREQLQIDPPVDVSDAAASAYGR